MSVFLPWVWEETAGLTFPQLCPVPNPWSWDCVGHWLVRPALNITLQSHNYNTDVFHSHNQMSRPHRELFVFVHGCYSPPFDSITWCVNAFVSALVLNRDVRLQGPPCYCIYEVRVETMCAELLRSAVQQINIWFCRSCVEDGEQEVATYSFCSGHCFLGQSWNQW